MYLNILTMHGPLNVDHTKTLPGQNVELLSLKNLLVRIVTTGV